MVRPSRFAVAPFLVALGLLRSACGLRGRAEYPTQDITYIVPYAPGGPADRVSRLLAELSEPAMKKKMVIVNKPGASATLGTADILAARPDGYTIGLAIDNTLQFQPQITKVPYNGVDDYQGIIKLGSTPFVLAVPADSKWKTLDDFLADVKTRPGEIRASVSGKLTPPDLTAQFFMQLAKVSFTTVPFTGGGAEAVANLLGGHVEAVVESTPGTVAQVQAGKIRPLVVFSDQRSGLYPDVPSAGELGYRGVPEVMHLVVGPKGMDQKVVEKLSSTFAEAWKNPKFQAFFKESGYTPISAPLGPAEVKKEQDQVRTLYTDLVKAMKIEKT